MCDNKNHNKTWNKKKELVNHVSYRFLAHNFTFVFLYTFPANQGMLFSFHIQIKNKANKSFTSYTMTW